MNRNPVRAAIEDVDCEPSNEFLSSLRTQLLADFTGSTTGDTAMSQLPSASPPESHPEYIELAPNTSRLSPNRRLMQTLVAAAACIALIATGAVIANRASDDPNATPRDVNPQEAHSLAQRALVPSNAFNGTALAPANGLGVATEIAEDWIAAQRPKQAAATIAELPACAQLTSVGLFPPTTKSATAYQASHNLNFLRQTVFVFATPQDASRAMDVIAGKLYPTCLFNLFDRVIPVEHNGAKSTSEAWDAPQIAPHGDRQVIIGQHTTVILTTGPAELHLLNAFVQVGRAISFINPRLIATGDVWQVDKTITDATSALNNVFGP